MNHSKSPNDKSSSIPLAALLPGLFGLLPFWGLALAIGHDIGLDPLTALLGLLAYGAVILSFVGALWWGLAANMTDATLSAPRNAMFLWSVFPALIGWFGMLLVPDMGLILLMSGFALQCLLDFMMHKKLPKTVPSWMLKLRIILTAGACTALVYAWHQLRNNGLG